MYINFYFVDIKKEKKTYIIIYKSDKQHISFNNINTLIYNKLNNLQLTNTDSINYHELFYIKQGISIIYNNEIWNKLVSIYLKKTELIYLIDEKYIKNIYSSEMILFLIDDYQNDIKQFLINYYNLELSFNSINTSLDNLKEVIITDNK